MRLYAISFPIFKRKNVKWYTNGHTISEQINQEFTLRLNLNETKKKKTAF